MSRRSQATRRRSYGRRQHEVRQRRDSRINADWSAQLFENDGARIDRADERELPGSIDAGRQ